MLILFASCITAVLVLERIPALRAEPGPASLPTATDAVYVFTAALLGFLSGFFLVVSFPARGIAPWAKTALVPPPPPWLELIIALVVLDLFIFVAHYFFHRIPVLWRFHRVHHSGASFNTLITFRSHLVSQCLLKLFAPLLMHWLGFSLPATTGSALIYTFFAVFTHANLRVPPSALDILFCGPRTHRFHHTRAGSEKNFGTVFAFWDLMLGTSGRGITSAVAADAASREESAASLTWLNQFREPFRVGATR